jgi:hypothetical protein
MFLVLFTALILTGSNFYTDKVIAEPVAEKTVTTQEVNKQFISPHLIVNSPKLYLNQTVNIKAKFDKFSTLGLDYKSAFKSSEEYISFLVKREDTTHDIPLSELKLFLKRAEAEKHIELKTNDEISIVGTVFSDALGDAWIDVQKLELIKKAPENKDGV